MIPLLLFLLGCSAIYLGVIEAAFSALMRLSLRIVAERTGRPDALGTYLDDPVLLFAPLRLLLAVVTAAATALLAAGIGVEAAHRVMLVVVGVGAFIAICELLVPLVIVRRYPERVLEILLPTFAPIARAFAPLAKWSARAVYPARRNGTPAGPDPLPNAPEARHTYVEAPAEEGLIAGEERRLLQSIVDFGETLVREVMTPRPDIVAIDEEATIGDLRALFREQEYSRFPVFKESLDNIVGFVFVKDLVALDIADDAQAIKPLLRPATVVPESKHVTELLKQFQRQTQIAIVVDEYGGTAGLVTLEDLLEEIVGEIRDEYDVESEPIVDEGGGRFLFNGKVDIDEVNQRLGVHIERRGFETVGGFLLTQLGRVPAVGERIEVDGLSVEVLDVERRRIRKVRMARHEPVPTQAGEKVG